MGRKWVFAPLLLQQVKKKKKLETLTKKTRKKSFYPLLGKNSILFGVRSAGIGKRSEEERRLRCDA